jgi:hypothetical protein
VGRTGIEYLTPTASQRIADSRRVRSAPLPLPAVKTYCTVSYVQTWRNRQGQTCVAAVVRASAAHRHHRILLDIDHRQQLTRAAWSSYSRLKFPSPALRRPSLEVSTSILLSESARQRRRQLVLVGGLVVKRTARPAKNDASPAEFRTRRRQW